jgi:hypothetical protein
MPRSKGIASPDKASEAIKSPQPPRISVSLKSRKRLLLSQRQGHQSQNAPLDESNHVSGHVSGDSTSRILSSTQDSFFTAADTRSLLLDGTAQGTTTLQGSLLAAPSLHGLQGKHSNRSQKSLFSRITTMNSVADVSNAPSSSQLQSHASTSTNMNQQIKPTVAETTAMATISTSPPSLFGAVMSRSAINTDHMLESTFGDNTHSHTSLHKAMDDEASVDNHLKTVQSRDESLFKSNKTKDESLLPFSPEKDNSSSKPDSNSSFITPNRKRKRQEEHILNAHDTPRQSILKDLGAPHGVAKTVNWDLQQQQPQDPVTPKFKSPKSSASPFSKYSPGVGLWKVLQSLKSQDPILNDPIHDIKMVENNKNDKVTLDTDAQAEAEEEEDWVEISLSPSIDDPTKQTSESLLKPQIFDWTLKRSMKLECYPCLPGKTIRNQTPMAIRNEAQIDFLAIPLAIYSCFSFTIININTNPQSQQQFTHEPLSTSIR